MSKQLILAEKPSVAMNYASALGDFKCREGYLENEKYIITWALGHLVSAEGIKVPDKWSYQDLPLLPEFTLAPVKERNKARQLKIIKNLVHLKEVESIIIGTDAGREGELIARYILAYVKNNKPIFRLWISSQTPEAVREGMNNLKPASLYDKLYTAARARDLSDWLVGINATRAYSTLLNELYSVGRVQTPTLAMIVEREKEIEGFKPGTYYVLQADVNSDKGDFKARYVEQVKGLSEAEEIKHKVNKQIGRVNKYESKYTRQNPPLLFDLTELQRECNKRWGWSAQKTLNLAQYLYERKLISYPRTSSRYLSSDLSVTFAARMKALAQISDFTSYVESLKNLEPIIKVINDSKIEDHYAIIPTDKIPEKDLNVDQLLLYRLISSRFIGIFYSPAVYQECLIKLEVQGYTFRTKSKVLLEEGWRCIPGIINTDEEDKEKEINIALPELKEGDKVYFEDIKIQEKETQPPKRYTEAGILQAMKNASNKTAIELSGDWGLGTAATRAAIIERLKKVGYIKIKNKSLYPSEKGIELITKIKTEELKSPALTAHWEDQLIGIEKGQVGYNQFMDEIKSYVQKIIYDTKDIRPESKKHLKNEIGKCPICNAPVIENSRAYNCSNWKNGCKFAIWKEVSGKKITEKQARKILSTGKTQKIKGFKSKKGNSFDACLVLTSEKKIGFEFS